MNTYKNEILLNTIEKVNKFVEITNKSKAEITLMEDKYIINGKSILGIYSLNLSNPLTVVISGKDKDTEKLFNLIKEKFGV